MSVNEAKSKFFEAKKAVEDCQRAIAGLRNKHDTLEASLPEITQQIETAERLKQASLDNYALHGDKQSESELKRSRTAYEQAVRQQSETNELIEATARSLKKMESEFVRLNNASELAKRQVWESISETYEAKITEATKDAVKTLVAIGCQIGRPRQFILDCLFRNPTHDDVQEIRRNLREEYSID